MTTSIPTLSGLDLAVIIAYLGGLLALGLILERWVKNPEDMFAAGGNSPWWLSGTSAFMTMFSSGTFVVWGGIAYLGGMVAVSICMTLGISALLVGAFIAAKWKDAGVSSASEFVRARYGDAAVHTYTWLGMVVRVLGSAVALYSIAVIICALIPLPQSMEAGMWGWLRSDSTGGFSLEVATVIIGIVVLVISGNLWAVLITDGLQFLVLTVAVTTVVPLLLGQDAVGGLSGFFEKAAEIPAYWVQGGELHQRAGETLSSLASGPFTWLFLGGWIVIHMLKIGGEWSFVQRFLCVPKRSDAIKVGLTFGALYLVSPFFWMLPPMVYRILYPIDAAMPAAEVMHMAEKAYMLACASVLPVGMVGLLVAAMLSATISMIDSEINVYAGAITRDIYGRLCKCENDEKRMLRVGRFMTILIGLLVIGLAIAVPYLGGAQGLILTITGLFVGPLVLPTLWALFSKRIGPAAVYVTVAVGALSSAILKFGLSDLAFVQAHSRTLDVAVGLIPPFLTLCFMEWLARRKTR
jgi:solute:Na+ symporter, SSS family